MVKAKPKDLKEKHREKDLKLKLKKENTEANVKHAELKKKKGEFYYFVHIYKKGVPYLKCDGIHLFPKVVSMDQHKSLTSCKRFTIFTH